MCLLGHVCRLPPDVPAHNISPTLCQPVAGQMPCLLCATLHPNSLDARIFALRISDSSTFHALHCRRAVFEPSRMLVHLCGTLCPFISRTATWLLQLSCAILSLISFLSTDFVLSAFGCDHINALYKFTITYYYLPTAISTWPWTQPVSCSPVFVTVSPRLQSIQCNVRGNCYRCRYWTHVRAVPGLGNRPKVNKRSK